MDRKLNDSVELFRAFTMEEIREREQKSMVLGGKWSTPFRGEDSSSYNVSKTD